MQDECGLFTVGLRGTAAGPRLRRCAASAWEPALRTPISSTSTGFYEAASRAEALAEAEDPAEKNRYSSHISMSAVTTRTV
jgi:hypothetical protein